MNFLLILSVFLSTVCTDAYILYDLEPLSDEIIKAINAFGTNWKAGRNFNGSQSIKLDTLVATREEKYYHDFPLKKNSKNDTAKIFDARTKWPECTSIGKIYDQTKGYPAWIYPAVAQVADRLCIKYGVQINVEATVERIIKSNGGFNSLYNSANIGQAFNHWSKKGIFTIKLSNDSTCLPLAAKCQQNVIQLNRYYQVDVEIPESVVDMMKDIELNGPLTAYMAVHSDFPSYKSGTYVGISYKFLGVQPVKLIGWEQKESDRAWIATNSWGTEWGDKGYFRINSYPNELYLSGMTPSVTLKQIDDIDSIPKSYTQDQLFELV